MRTECAEVVSPIPGPCASSPEAGHSLGLWETGVRGALRGSVTDHANCSTKHPAP